MIKRNLRQEANARRLDILDQQEMAVRLKEAMPFQTDTDRTEPKVDRDEENMEIVMHGHIRESQTSQKSVRKAPQLTQFSPGLANIDLKLINQ